MHQVCVSINGLSFLQQDTDQWFIHVVYKVTHITDDAVIKHDIHLLRLHTLSGSTVSATTSVTSCEAAITMATLLSMVTVITIILALICWKWNKIKDGCMAVFGNYFKGKTETSPLSKIGRRSHTYRAEIQELPQHSFPTIHGNTEQCTENNTVAASGPANKRSKKYIVETTM